jgi:hypothetical protein
MQVPRPIYSEKTATSLDNCHTCWGSMGEGNGGGGEERGRGLRLRRFYSKTFAFNWSERGSTATTPLATSPAYTYNDYTYCMHGQQGQAIATMALTPLSCS